MVLIDCQHKFLLNVHTNSRQPSVSCSRSLYHLALLLPCGKGYILLHTGHTRRHGYQLQTHFIALHSFQSTGEVHLQPRLINQLSNTLSTSQHGFLSGRSTVTQLLCPLQSDIVYQDLLKAFYTVPHLPLLQKLANAGVQGPLHDWFSSYLSNRSQRVLISGVITSKSLPVLSGVPQGSILGPLLFLNLPEGISSQTMVYIFAVVTKLARTITSESEVDVFQEDINKVYDCTNRWNMKFNTDKCQLVSISRKKQHLQTAYSMGKHSLSTSDLQKDLSVVVNDGLKWGSHITSVVSKANKRLGLLYRTSNPSFDVKVKHELYLTLVKSYLGYASEVWWSPLDIGCFKKIKSIQKNLPSSSLAFLMLCSPRKNGLSS